MHGNVCGKSVDGRIALFCVSVCMVMYGKSVDGRIALFCVSVCMVMYVVRVWTAGLPCFVYLCAW